VTEILNVEVTDCNSKLQLPEIDRVCVQRWCSNKATRTLISRNKQHASK